jgi:predicted Zn finger-like uncharacterized protein
MANNRPPLFFCPNCKALYQVVRTEAGPEAADHEINCRECKAPFPAREGKFVLKYFMLRRGALDKKWGHPRPSA